MSSRFLLIALYLLGFVLMAEYFLVQKPVQNTSTHADVVLHIEKDSLTIPNIPHIEIANNLTGSFILNPCTDLSLSIESKPFSFSGIESTSRTFCNALTIESGSKTLLPFSELPKLFSNFSGKYILSVKTPAGDRLTTFTMETPGAIRSFLTSVIYEPIYNSFVALLTYLPGHSLGWAIIILTLVIRLILLVPQHKALTSQKKLQVIQPKIKEIQKKYKGDQAKLGAEMLALYKEEGVNPMGSCLPLLIQMPILIGLYWVVSGITDTSNYYHLYSVFQNFDPRNINSFFYGLDLKHVGGIVGGIFALALGGLQYIQAKLSFGYNNATKKDASIEESKTEALASEFAVDPDMMKNMMLYMMPVVMAVSSFFFPLGIGLYMFIGTIFVIVQQWYVNKIAKNK